MEVNYIARRGSLPAMMVFVFVSIGGVMVGLTVQTEVMKSRLCVVS